jgi:hypothetical protein
MMSVMGKAVFRGFFTGNKFKCNGTRWARLHGKGVVGPASSTGPALKLGTREQKVGPKTLYAVTQSFLRDAGVGLHSVTNLRELLRCDKWSSEGGGAEQL